MNGLDRYVWRILLIDDDEDDFYLAREMLLDARRDKFILEWASSYDAGKQAVCTDTYDAILMDYDLGIHTGIELIREVIASGCRAPVILLTGRGSYEVDVEAMEAGAADYISKNEVNAAFLERSIRYAIERKQSEETLNQNQRDLAAMLDEIKKELVEREKAQQALRESEARFQRATNAIDEGLWDYDYQTGQMWWNHAYDRLFGPRPHGPEMQTNWWADRIHPEDRQRAVDSMNAALQSSTYWICDYRFARSDGTYAYVSDRASIERDEEGNPLRMTGAMLDMTELKQATRALQESQQRLLLTQNAAQLGTWHWQIATDSLFMDERCKMLVGLSQDEEISFSKFREMIFLEDRDNTEWLSTQALDNHQMIEIEYRVQWPDGSQHWIFAKGQGIYDEDGKPRGLVGIALDITRRKQDEDQARANLARIEVQRRLIDQREQERLQIARDLHDGPLQELTIVSFMLNEALSDTHEPLVAAKVTEAQAALQAQIRELRSFSVMLRPPVLSSFGLEKAIRAHLNDLRERYPDLSFHFEAEQQHDHLSQENRLALYRIYQEAMNNIVKHAQATQVIIRFSITGPMAKLEIRDNGKGFNPPAEWIELARQGHLGLVGIRERVEAVGGDLDLTSAPGAGTTMRIYIPAEKMKG